MVNPDAPYDDSGNENQLDETPPNDAPILLPDPVVQTEKPARKEAVIRKLAKVAPLTKIKSEPNVSDSASWESQQLVGGSRSNNQRTSAIARQQCSTTSPTSHRLGPRGMGVALDANAARAIGISLPHQGGHLPIPQRNQFDHVNGGGLNPAEAAYLSAALQLALRGWPNEQGPPVGMDASFAPRGAGRPLGMNFPTGMHNPSHVGPMVRTRPPVGGALAMGPQIPNGPPIPMGSAHMTNRQFPSNPGVYYQGASGSKPCQIQSRFPHATANGEMQQWDGRLTTDMVSAAGTGNPPATRAPYVKTSMGARMIAQDQMMSACNGVHAQALQQPGEVRFENQPTTQNPAQNPSQIPHPYTHILPGAAIRNGPAMSGHMSQLSHPTTVTPALDVNQPQVPMPVKRHQDMDIPSHTQSYPYTYDPPILFTPMQFLPPTKLQIMEDFERSPYKPDIEAERAFGVPLPPKPIDVDTWLSSYCAPHHL